MEIEFFGHNAIKIKQGSESIGFDLEAVNGGWYGCCAGCC